jgi:hypothetical protein
MKQRFGMMAAAAVAAKGKTKAASKPASYFSFKRELVLSSLSIYSGHQGVKHLRTGATVTLPKEDEKPLAYTATK